jgi:hypothetical protein
MEVQEKFSDEMADRTLICNVICQERFESKSNMEHDVINITADKYQKRINPWLAFAGIISLIGGVIISVVIAANSYGDNMRSIKDAQAQDHTALVDNIHAVSRAQEEIQLAKRNNMILEEIAQRNSLRCAKENK